MPALYDKSAPKKATNLTVNSNPLQKTKAYKINLSKSFEAHLVELIRQKQAERWLKQSKEATGAFNERVEKQGFLGDTLRRF